MITEHVRVSMDLAEVAMTAGFPFVLGFFVGWWTKGR
jgi:hypothetical protein